MDAVEGQFATEEFEELVGGGSGYVWLEVEQVEVRLVGDGASLFGGGAVSQGHGDVRGELRDGNWVAWVGVRWAEIGVDVGVGIVAIVMMMVVLAFGFKRVCESVVGDVVGFDALDGRDVDFGLEEGF